MPVLFFVGQPPHDLGTLGGDNSYARGINESGQVTGWAEISGGSTIHAFLYSAGSMTDLGALDSYSHGVDLNNCGQVTGYAGISGGSASHAFLCPHPV